MNPAGGQAQGSLLRRCAVGALALLTILLTAGCHKKSRVSRSATPVSPPVYSSSEGSQHRGHAEADSRGTGGRPSTAGPVRAPSTNDNLPSSGAFASVETGLASWYGPPYSNRRGANGEIYDANALTAAHRTLPMGTVVRVTNLSTQQSVTVKITDRGPFVRGRLIDLSIAAAKSTGLYRMGVARVRVEVLEQSAGANTPGRWCVQVGAFTDEGHASRLKADLLRRYSSTARVIEFPGPTGHWVRINPASAGRAQASAIAGSIRPEEPEAQAYLVRLD